MLSKRMLMMFLSVSMLAFVAIGQAYGQMSGTATFLDPGDPEIVMVWNINDGISASSSTSDSSNYPYQATPTWQITYPQAAAIRFTELISWGPSGGDNIDDFVVEFGLDGLFSPVVSMREYNSTQGQSHLWFAVDLNDDPASQQDAVAVLLTDTIRVTEFNVNDVDVSPRPHIHPRLGEVTAYDTFPGHWAWEFLHTRPQSPTDVKLSVDGKTLTWNAVIGVVGYNVWISRAGVGSLSPDYFCVNQLPGPFSYLNDGMVTGTSYTLPAAWQGFVADLYVVTSVDDVLGTNSFYSAKARSLTLEERVSAIEAILAGGVGGGLNESEVNGLIGAALAPVSRDIENIESDINTIIGTYNSHVHDKGSGSRNTTTPIPQIR
jgi:hypothetical protein